MKNYSVDLDRMDDFVDCLARMAAGDLSMRMPISIERDELDAISFGINMLAGELELQTEKKAEALRIAERANRAKSDFIAAMSHELRTPLTALILASELLELETDAEQKKNCVRSIRSGAATLAKIVEDLLDLSMIEADRFDVRLKPIFPDAVASEAVLSLSALALAKRIRMDLKLGPGDVQIVSDPQRLKQILVNLLGNAIKFSRDDGTIALAIFQREGFVLIEVEDDGIGIPEPQQAKLFEPFFRASGKAREIPGSGLGLALSRRVATRLGADLHLAWSEEGRGSRFQLRLPLAKEKPDPGPDTSSRASAASRPTGADSR